MRELKVPWMLSCRKRLSREGQSIGDLEVKQGSRDTKRFTLNLEVLIYLPELSY